MSADVIVRPAYSNWPRYNESLRDVVAALSDAQLAIRPSSERWPLWATIGHAACQRVFWLPSGWGGQQDLYPRLDPPVRVRPRRLPHR